MDALMIEQRVDSLESILGSFIVQTGTTIKRLERSQIVLETEMRALKDEMLDFKNEMREFKNEMREFKDEMRGFKNEMLEFKDEMLEFKDEMLEFKSEAERQMKDLNKKWGELANRLGTFAEDIVAPNIPFVAEKYFGLINYDFFITRSRKKHRNDPHHLREFDAIAVYGEWVIMNETKATVRMHHVEDFIQFIKEEIFFEYFPEYKGKTLIPVFSAMSIPDNMVEYLSRNNVFAMAMTGGTMDFLNYDTVRPAYIFS